MVLRKQNRTNPQTGSEGMGNGDWTLTNRGQRCSQEFDAMYEIVEINDMLLISILDIIQDGE